MAARPAQLLGLSDRVCIPPPPPDPDCSDIPYRNFTVRWDVADRIRTTSTGTTTKSAGRAKQGRRSERPRARGCLCCATRPKFTLPRSPLNNRRFGHGAKSLHGFLLAPLGRVARQDATKPASSIVGSGYSASMHSVSCSSGCGRS